MRAATLLNAGLLIALFALVCERTRHASSPQQAVRILVSACAGAVGVTILCSRVFSGEYVLWLVPFAIALCASRSGLVGLGLFCLALIALKVTYRFYPLVMSASPDGMLLSAVKNLLILLAVLALLVPVLRRGARARDRRRMTQIRHVSRKTVI